MSGLDSNLEETFGQANNTNPLWIELVQEMQQWRHSNPEAQWLQPQAFAALRHYWTKFKTTEFGYHYSKAKKLIDGEEGGCDESTTKKSTAAKDELKTKVEIKNKKEIIERNHLGKSEYLQYTLSLSRRKSTSVIALLQNKGSKNYGLALDFDNKLVTIFQLKSGCTIKHFYLNDTCDELSVILTMHPLMWNPQAIHAALMNTGMIPDDPDSHRAYVREEECIKAIKKFDREQVKGEIVKREQLITIPLSQKVLRDPSNIIACVPNFDVSSDNKMEHNFAYFEMPIDEEENVDKMKSPEKVQVNGTHKFNTSSSNSNGTRQNSSTQGSSNNGNDTRTGNNGNHNKKFRNASQGNFYNGNNNGNEDSSHGFTSDSDEDMDGQEKFEKEKLEKEVEQMKLQNATLKDTVSATTELSDRLKSMNDELQKADEKKSIELQRSLQYIRDPDKLRERDQREKINLAMKVDQLKKQAQIENDKLKTQLQATHDETQVTNKKLNDALLNQSNENDKLRNELKAKEEKVMLLKKSMETEKVEFLSKLRSSYNDAKSMHDKMNDAIKAKDVENDHLRNQLNSNFEEAKSMHDTMNQALMSKDIENDNLTKALQETMAKLHSAEERLKSTKMYATGLERSIEHDSNEFGNVPKSTSGSKRKKNRNGSSTMAFEVATTVEKDLIVFTPEKEELKDNTNKEIHQVPVQSHDVPLPPGEEKDASFNGSASMISDNHSADQL